VDVTKHDSFVVDCSDVQTAAAGYALMHGMQRRAALTPEPLMKFAGRTRR